MGIEINILEKPINVILNGYDLYKITSSDNYDVVTTKNSIVKLVGLAYDEDCHEGICFIYVIYKKKMFCLDLANPFRSFLKFNSKDNICLVNEEINSNFLENTYKYFLKNVNIRNCVTVDSYFLKLYHSKTIFDKIREDYLNDS